MTKPHHQPLILSTETSPQTFGRERGLPVHTDITPRVVFIRDQFEVIGTPVSKTEPYCVVLENPGEQETALIYINNQSGFSFILNQGEEAQTLLSVEPFLNNTMVDSLLPGLTIALTESHGSFGGIVSQEMADTNAVLSTAIDQPFLVLQDIESNQTTLYWLNVDEKQWYEQQLETVNSLMVSEAKMLASINPAITAILVRSKFRNEQIAHHGYTFHPRLTDSNLSKRDELPNFQAVSQVVAKITEGKQENQPNDSANKLWRKLPELIANEARKLGQPINSDKLKAMLAKSPIDASTTIRSIIEAISFWPEFNYDLALLFLSETLPALLSVSSLARLDNNGPSMNLALKSLTHGVGNKQVNILHQMCPPYHYQVTDTERNYIAHHRDHDLLPTVGDRFPLVLKTFGAILSPLVEQGVLVNEYFLTYSGELNHLDDLVELGGDVIAHYKGQESKIMQTLKAAFEDMQKRLISYSSKSGIVTQAVSIEAFFSRPIREFVADFFSVFPGAEAVTFPDGSQEGYGVDFYPHGAKEAIGDWLQLTAGSRDEFLIHFVMEEIGYRTIQSLVSRNGLLRSALNEAMLYRCMTAYALANKMIIIGTETTTNYMRRSLEHALAPVIMGKEFDVREPLNPLAIRQPYNYPEGTK